jgi:hypothetical protein
MDSTKEVATLEQPDTQTSSSVAEPASSSQWAYLKHYFTSRDGWIGDYVCSILSYSTQAESF